MIKMIFFDIDGTTYRHDIKDVPNTTYLALTKLKANGIKLAICTSRAYEEMCKLPTKLLKLMDMVVCAGGQTIYVNDKLVYQNYLDKIDSTWLIKYFDNNDIRYRYVTSDGNCYLSHDDESVTKIFKYLYDYVPRIKKYANEQLIHILYYCDDSSQKQEIIKNLKNSCHIDIGRANEIQSLGVDKGSAIFKAANYYGISKDEIAAFGDGDNDITMLKNAKIGIALGNASLKLKEVADQITDNIEDDGLYNACLKNNWI